MAERTETINGAEKNTTYKSTRSNFCNEWMKKKVAKTISIDLTILILKLFIYATISSK